MYVLSQPFLSGFYDNSISPKFQNLYYKCNACINVHGVCFLSVLVRCPGPPY